MPCGKEKLHLSKNPENPKVIKHITEKILNDKHFGFFQVDIHVPEQLHDHFSEFSPLFVLGEVPESQIPEHMKEYKIATGRKTICQSKKPLGVLRAKKILLYSPLLKWYLNHGLLVTKIYKYLSFTANRPFKWFPEEVSNARRQADEAPDKKQLGDTAKLKGNSFYGKMIENLLRHVRTMYTDDEKKINAAFRSQFFDDLEEIGDAYEVYLKKRQIKITRPYQCGISVYQLAKLRMLEFYYDFLDKFIDRRDFELLQMDTDSFYFAMAANDLEEIIRPELRDLYAKEKSKWLVTDKYSKRAPGLFKPEFKGKRMITLTSKCYYADGGADADTEAKISCKGVSKSQNEMTWERYRNALGGSIYRASNKGFRLKGQSIVSYQQDKLGLSAYYDKRIVHKDGIHTGPLTHTCFGGNLVSEGTI